MVTDLKYIYKYLKVRPRHETYYTSVARINPAQMTNWSLVNEILYYCVNYD